MAILNREYKLTFELFNSRTKNTEHEGNVNAERHRRYIIITEVLPN